MGRISLELVPREEGIFSEELKTVREKFPCVDTLNIPDILKFEMRIPEACKIAAGYFGKIIPHIRAVSIDREEPFPYADQFYEQGIDEVLVILGDNPEIVSRSQHPCDSLGLIRKLKSELPYMKVYAAIDQWRQSFSREMEYVAEKLKAGADGFFTQPFFDIETLENYARELPETDIFWGIAPVIRESSKNYWETKNKVIFPEDFACTMDWNKNFARDVLDRAADENTHIYFCPITVDFIEYLTGII